MTRRLAEVASQNSDAAAGAIVTFAYDTSTVEAAQETARVQAARADRQEIRNRYTR